MKVLHVSAEVVPFSKTGGLADVAAALPAHQRLAGIEARTLTPLYGFLDPQKLNLSLVGGERFVRLGGEMFLTRLWTDEAGHYLFLDCPGLLDRPTLYGEPDEAYADNPLRFAIFCKVAALIAADADVVHLHDWHAGLASIYLGHLRPTVMTIHNMAYMGLADFDWADRLEIPPGLRTWRGLEFHGQLSLLKAGLVGANRITTVSPRYAMELLDEPGAQGLSGLMRHRASAIRGILNGIDEEVWNPATDPALPSAYSAEDLTGRAECRAHLHRQMDLPLDDRPLFGVVARGTWQKGFDLIVDAAPELVDRGARFVVLTSGERQLIDQMRALSAAHPEAVALCLGFDDALARRIYAGCDFVLVPSRFEPCGLTQLIGMRYGAVPVVRHTGGLADTVKDGVTGLTFEAAEPDALVEAVGRAIELYASPARYAEMQARGMASDWSWSGPARAYEALYQELIAEANPSAGDLR